MVYNYDNVVTLMGVTTEFELLSAWGVTKGQQLLDILGIGRDWTCRGLLSLITINYRAAQCSKAVRIHLSVEQIDTLNLYSKYNDTKCTSLIPVKNTFTKEHIVVVSGPVAVIFHKV